MTRVFVYEYTCAAPPASPEAGGAASLRAEGEAMLRAILADLGSIPGVEAFTLRESDEEETAFRAAARGADWSLIVAPEFDRILESRCRWVLEEGGKLLGPSPNAVRLCADKWALFQWWNDRGVRTPMTIEVERGRVSASWETDTGSKTESNTGRSRDLVRQMSFVLKPRFGAGSQLTFVIASISDEIQAQIHIPTIAQPFIAGQPASVAFLIGDSYRFPLRAASQRFRSDAQIHYLGGTVPLAPPLEDRAQRIAAEAIDELPGLFGYIGVDVILGDDGRDWAIEINPRLTTSYVGLRKLAESNLAEATLRIANGETPELHWRNGSVEFAADGTVAMRSE